MSIGVVLSAFRRPENMAEQIAAVKNQSVKPDQLHLWYNNGMDHQSPVAVDNSIFSMVNNYGALSFKNLGVWARFIYALNLNTEYIAIFDDDTIPGKDWFKNCLTSMSIKEGIYGSLGVILTNVPMDINFGTQSISNDYHDIRPTSITEVDYVGHTWFFKKEWLWSMFKYPIQDFFGGEDMQLSFAAQKELGVRTYVPPQLPDNKDSWGSLKRFELGAKKALSDEGNMRDRFKQYAVNLKTKYNWNLLCERSNV